MHSTGEAGLTPSVRLLETVARTLRHEVGDLLQTVYSTVAILQERLPGDQQLERRLLHDLKGRAENCKHELDAVVDLICPLNLSSTFVDLTELAAGLVNAYSARFPHLAIHKEAEGPVSVEADPRRLSQVGTMLLLSACQAAQHQVRIRTVAHGGEAEWSITDDGYGATPEQLEWLRTPFPSTHHAQFGLGVALARRMAELHGGRFTGANLPEGGFRASLFLPLKQHPVD